jgi:hypothetical protein
VKYFAVNLEDKSDPDFRGKFEFDYLGPTVFAAINF